MNSIVKLNRSTRCKLATMMAATELLAEHLSTSKREYIAVTDPILRIDNGGVHACVGCGTWLAEADCLSVCAMCGGGDYTAMSCRIEQDPPCETCRFRNDIVYKCPVGHRLRFGGAPQCLICDEDLSRRYPELTGQMTIHHNSSLRIDLMHRAMDVHSRRERLKASWKGSIRQDKSYFY